MNSFSMALKSIKRNKGRSALTMLGIIIGITAVVTMVSLVQGMQSIVMESYTKMGTNIVQVSSYTNNLDLTKQIQEKCDELSQYIDGMSPSSQTSSMLRYRSKKMEDSTVYFGSDTFDVCGNWEIEKGRMFDENEATRRGRVCVIGAGVVDNLFDYENPIGKNLRIGKENFEIIGTFKLKYQLGEWSMDNMVVIPYSNNRVLMDSTQITDYVIKCKTSDGTKKVVEQLNSAIQPLVPTNGYFEAYSNNSWQEESNSTMNVISIVLGGIAGISLIVGGIGIMNIMLVSVTERTREIGIRKAIGARRRDIIVQFLIESGTVSLLGGIIGIILGFLLTLVLGKILFNRIVYPSVSFTAIAVVFSISIGVFFGFYPANRASKLNPIDALRNE